MSQHWAGTTIGAIVLFVLGIGFGAGLVAYRYPTRPHHDGDDAKITFVVSKGMTPSAIARALAEKGILNHPSWFRFYATERGDSSKVKPGRYQFSPSMTPQQILDALIVGVPEEEIAVTIPEGKNIVEWAQILEEAGVAPSSEFLAAARDPNLLRQLGVPGVSVEGYLYPDRYQFRPGTPPAKTIARLVKRAKDVFAELKEKHKPGLQVLQKGYGFDDPQIVLMASLVEKETGQPQERPRIAGVFLNRLRLPTFKPHLLQTDPTIVYGCTVPVEVSDACKGGRGPGGAWERIHKIHLEDKDNPYNTYTHEGLPPGPICNPGRAALEAVLAPDNTPYLYFVSKNDGTHYFSKTKAEHEAAVDKYQRHGGT